MKDIQNQASDLNIPIASYQIGTTQVQYTDQELDQELNQEIEMPEPTMDFIVDNSVIPDINELSQNNILNSSQSPTKNKYNIIDLFWLLNPNYLKKQTDNNQTKTEAEFVTINYNCDFGNLKVNLYKINPEAIQGNVVFLQSMTLFVSGTIYPASAFKILNVNQDIKFTCIEQLITNTNENWQQERPVVQLDKNNNYIDLNIYNKQNSNMYYYRFKDWQLKAFQSALKLTYTNGLNLRVK